MIEQSPQQPVLYQFRAASRRQRGNYAGALADSQRCLELAPYRSRGEFASILQQHVQILEKLYQYDLALHFASMTLRIEGETPRTRQLVGQLYSGLGKRELAAHWSPQATQPRKPAIAGTTAETPH
jgi:hypothetical protein